MEEIHLSEKAQEFLEKCWIEERENKSGWKAIVRDDEPLCAELLKKGCATKRGDYLELTQKGWQEARSCVRRHRLAERLLMDVIDIKKELVRDIGCEFEHLLRKDVEENICTLLGHPRLCPHEKSIPEGECCKVNKRSPQRLALPLSECEEGQRGKIAYIVSHDETTMNKLTAIGLLPGLSIQLLKRRPSYLFQIGESQFAIDRELAEKIHIRTGP